ncbi:MAG: TlpA family protein disulfide reductase [Legionellales bacterium]|nr:TlpA family protein disulfide reductase [Legionellales bacterium]
MRHTLRIGLLIITLCAVLLACKSDPKILGQDLQGKQYALADFKGKWLIVNYWASWCKPCYEEIPHLNEFYHLHHTQAMMLGVNYDRMNLTQLKEFAQKQAIIYPLLTGDPATVLGITAIPALPATYIFDHQGHLFKTLLGPQTVKDLELAMGLTNSPVLELKHEKN